MPSPLKAVLQRNPQRATRLRNLLWEDTGAGTRLKMYALLDAARGRDVYEVVRYFNPDHHCLFRGNLSERMLRSSPYLIDVHPDSEFTRDVLELGWGDSWGVFLYAPPELPFENLRQHLRRFLRVHDEGGRKLFFRYYDPRVLRVYLPTCTPDELKLFCGPVTRYVMEAAEPRTLIRFDRAGRLLERSFHAVG